MEKLKLYNWYGVEFESILPEQSLNLNAYKKQVNNIFQRTKDSNKQRKKIDKDLFLRSRTKLQDTLKRELSSHRVAFYNKIQVLKDSAKKLKYSNSIISLINYELKKLKKQKNDIWKYLNDFEKSLKNTGDEPEDKIRSLKLIFDKSKKEELQLMQKFAVYSAIKKYKSLHKDDEFNIQKIWNNLSQFEKEYFQRNQNVKDTLKTFYLALEEKRLHLYRSKLKILDKYKQTKAIQKELYKKERKNIILDFKKRILNSEYEYNEISSQRNREASEKKQMMLKKIHEQKQQIISIQSENERKIKAVVHNSKKEEKQCSFTFGNYYKFVKYNYLFNLYSSYIKQLSLIIEKDLDSLFNTAKADFEILFKNGFNVKLEDYKNTFNNLKEDVEKIEKNTNHDDEIKVAKKVYFSPWNHLDYRKISRLIINALKFQHLAGIQKSYTYENEFSFQKYNIFMERALELKIKYEEFNKEKTQALLDLLKHKKNNTVSKERETYKISKVAINKAYSENIQNLKNKVKVKEITRQAYKNRAVEVKIDRKEGIYNLKLASEVEKNKEILKTLFFRKRASIKITDKIAESKINEAIKTFPIETKKRIMLLSALLGFLLPGLPELLWFRQITKGIILITFTVFIWAVIVPFAFGAYWDKMGGIPGFSDLGKGLFDSSRGIFTDARYYLFGGVISAILFTISLIYFFVNGISAFRVARSLQQGLRPSKWSYTKKWLETSGFPWLISIPGWILMLFIVISPVITSILISFTNYGFNHEAPGKPVDWVGLEQWGKWWIFRDLKLGLSLSRVISWTIIWTIFSALLPIMVGIFVAVVTNGPRIKGKKIFRIIFIMPWAIPAFVTIIFLKSAFQADSTSLFNYIFLRLGIISEAINWWASPNIIKTLLILIQTWIGSAWIFMLVTGNLQSIPRDIYEAGAIDGAKNQKLFRYLTLPALFASISPMLITQFVGAFNNFTIISLFSGGSPQYVEPTIFGEGTTDIIISWVYKLSSGAVKVDGDQAFAAALTTIAAAFSVGVASYGFVKTMSRRD